VHITGIGLAVGSALMMTLRLLGSGGLLIVAEPVRELVTFSFWLKMACVALMVVVFALFQRSVRTQGQRWEQVLARRRAVRLAAPSWWSTCARWASRRGSGPSPACPSSCSGLPSAFAVSAVTGSLMFVTNARVYAHNTSFRVKMVLLALAGATAPFLQRNILLRAGG
jgi:hypothetical protein